MGASLNEAWAKFATDLSQPIRTPVSNRKPAITQAEDEAEHEDDIRLLMHQASLAAASIEEMLGLMHADALESDDDDSSSNLNSSRHASMRGSRTSSRPGSRPHSRMTLGAVPSEDSRHGSCVAEHNEEGPLGDVVHRMRSLPM